MELTVETVEVSEEWIKAHSKSSARNSLQIMPDGVFHAADLRRSFFSVYLPASRVFGRSTSLISGVF